MEIVVKKIGKSLGVSLPQSLINEANLSEGSRVDIVFDHDKIVMSKLKNPKRDIKEMLSRITPENIYEEIETGESVGKEIW